MCRTEEIMFQIDGSWKKHKHRKMHFNIDFMKYYNRNIYNLHKYKLVASRNIRFTTFFFFFLITKSFSNCS